MRHICVIISAAGDARWWRATYLLLQKVDGYIVLLCYFKPKTLKRFLMTAKQQILAPCEPIEVCWQWQPFCRPQAWGWAALPYSKPNTLLQESRLINW